MSGATAIARVTAPADTSNVARCSLRYGNRPSRLRLFSRCEPRGAGADATDDAAHSVQPSLRCPLRDGARSCLDAVRGGSEPCGCVRRQHVPALRRRRCGSGHILVPRCVRWAPSPLPSPRPSAAPVLLEVGRFVRGARHGVERVWCILELTPVKRIFSFWQRHRRGALQALVVVALWIGISAYQTRKHLPSGAGAAPAFTLTDLSGRELSLEQLRGRKVLLHFFATWCGVCKAELPSLSAVHAGLDEDEVLLAILADAGDPERARRFANEHELSYPVLLATDDVLRAYAVDRFPTNYYLNGDGSVSRARGSRRGSA